MVRLHLEFTTWTVILFLAFISLVAPKALCGQNLPPFTQASPRPYGMLKPPSVPFDQGPVIPGLRQDAVPQGITYAPEQDRIILSDGTTVPLWYLDGENCLKKIDFPPMAEGITMIGGRLAVLSESGATKYQRGGKGALDFILLLHVPGGGELRGLLPQQAFQRRCRSFKHSSRQDAFPPPCRHGREYFRDRKERRPHIFPTGEAALVQDSW